MLTMRAIGAGVEEYAVDNGVYPVVSTTAALKTIMSTGGYLKFMPLTDGWGNNFIIESTFSNYTLYSTGKDGYGSTCTAGTTSSFNEEICFGAGQFIRYPAGKQGS